MLRKLLCTVLLLCFVGLAYSQRKKDLLAKIDTLQMEVKLQQDSLLSSQRKARSLQTQLELVQGQIGDLKATNMNLLQNLNNFAEVSNKNSKNVTEALRNLEKKESQIRDITQFYMQNDSIALVLVSHAKQHFGESAKIGVGESEVLLNFPIDKLIVDQKPTDEATAIMQQLATMSSVAPDHKIEIAVLTIDRDFATAAANAQRLGDILEQQAKKKQASVRCIGKDGGFSDGVRILFTPDYRKFYRETKKNLQLVN
ncbi:MAG: hypothetical protein OIF50_12305 [Flavobacteriaceae bacterium]|nr:hypothetical protein [Flavobacteriaceae bacterium]